MSTDTPQQDPLHIQSYPTVVVSRKRKFPLYQVVWPSNDSLYPRNPAADAPHRYSYLIAFPSGVHVTRHDHGEDFAPRLVNWIEDRIDDLSGSATWVGGVNHYRGYCVERDCTQRRIISEDRPNI